ncbi:MAG TPA: 1-acyl-sn-glycerol-3-phosphate acyltransferase [Hellea balneolensis]|uniref:1-acyl-sn-glycerol-3-phosphate acyltransferase n=1 Tax=Hellea balneolensis TaxID=287478 RepID=A0A7C5LV97_9PROT|nr:1-acyl-sn-glycerol-3-phosphate acyltransferase [Hellea balneolensis]
MRSFVFNILFYTVSVVYALFCVLLSILPGSGAVRWGIRTYTKTMVWLMRNVAGIKVKVAGQDRLPAQGPYIIAPKHQSYGDGFVMYAHVDNLSFVTGDHLEKFMTVKRILQKLGAVVIDNCGGSDARDRLQTEAERVRKEGRKLLIYPEGHLSQIGTHHRFRKGVFYLYKDFNCPVIPVATNLGQRWNQNDWHKYPGPAIVEFQDPIEPGLSKDAFMKELEHRIESRSLELLDMENLGALNPDDIGQLRENHVARAKRLAREN